jgi:hypothetical protein
MNTPALYPPPPKHTHRVTLPDAVLMIMLTSFLASAHPQAIQRKAVVNRLCC